MPGMSRAPAACRRRELTTRAKSATDVDAYIARRPKFKADLSRFEIAKGSIRFPLDEPLPLALIGRIVRFRAREKPTREKQKA